MATTEYGRSIQSAFEKLKSSRCIIEPRPPVRSWRSFVDIVESKGLTEGYCFRGQSKYEWALKTSLERMLSDSGIRVRSAYDDYIEEGLIRRFKRQYHLYSSTPPAFGDHVEWLSVMQHHGAPTRLLDITYSPYVALYFALEGYVVGQEAALWCIDQSWLGMGWQSTAPEWYHKLRNADKEGLFLELFEQVLQDVRPGIYMLNPFRMPSRLTLQQGGFLMPTDIRIPFMANLSTMPKNGPGRKVFRSKGRIIKLKLSFSSISLVGVRRGLGRMNITSESLFPGLDGYSRGLRDRILMKEQRWAYKKGF